MRGLRTLGVSVALSEEDLLGEAGKSSSKSSNSERGRRWLPLEDGNTESRILEVGGFRARKIGPLEDPEEDEEFPEKKRDRASILFPVGNPSKERPLEHCELQRDESLCNAICSFGVNVLERESLH